MVATNDNGKNKDTTDTTKPIKTKTCGREPAAVPPISYKVISRSGPLPIFLVKKVRKAVACPHRNTRAYALDMCKKCYHKNGRTKPATGCPHHDRSMYCRNVCKGCYLKLYRSSVKSNKTDEDED